LPDLWSIERGPGGAFARCAALQVDGVTHAFGLRGHDAGKAGSAESLARLAACAPGPQRMLRQVHRAAIVRGCEIRAGGVEADGAWDRLEDLSRGFLAVVTADCVPILLASRDGRFVAALHAGWRGTAQRIAARAVDVLREQGCPPEGLLAAIGPSIGPCCYPVSEHVAAAVARASGVAVKGEAGPTGLDLRGANREQLLAAGVAAESVHAAPWCTACETELFFSYRRDGVAAGRQLSLIGPIGGRP